MKWFTINELCKSDIARVKGIQNVPTVEAIRNLERLVQVVLDPVREEFGRPILVNSGYRCATLNRLVGGSATSQHMTGQAVDITAKDKKDNRVIFEIIKDLGKYDQLIWEEGDEESPSWIHVSYREPMRKQVMFNGI